MTTPRPHAEMAAQHINNMKWKDAPQWATHIIGWVNEPQTCYWSEKRDGKYFCDQTRGAGLFSFGLIEHPKEMFGWVVLQIRPAITKQGGAA
jgi:hypothetical protein